MRSTSNFRLPFLLLLLPLFTLLPTSTQAAHEHLQVGVILDRATLIGNVSWTCIAMAAEDFYTTYPNYSSRLSLHWRDTDDEDAVSAASAALDLLQNAGVEALIGPQASSQAKFVAELGGRAQVPVLSFSASLPRARSSPYFFHTAWNGLSQATAVASLVNAFGWREVATVLEDSDYGAAFAPFLTDALQEVDVHVSCRSMVAPRATDAQIASELNKLKANRTRVFIVHMYSYSLALDFFNLTKSHGMMKNGYVWIVTYSLTDIVDLMGSSAMDLMQGVIGLSPLVRENETLHRLNQRWKEDLQFKFNVTTFGLWAYDTVWALARAAEDVRALNSSFMASNSTNSTDLGRLGKSLRGPELRRVLLSTSFAGLGGRFRLNGQVLESGSYEIVNLVDGGKRRIGLWSPTKGISLSNVNATDGGGVEWPGGGRRKPKGWECPIGGKELVVGVPVKPGFEQFININESSGPKGYCIQLFEAVMKEFSVNIKYKTFSNKQGESNGTYDDLVYHLSLQGFDAVVGDVTIRENRTQYADFTQPFTESGLAMVVPTRDARRKDAWTFLKPFSLSLWLASAAFFVFTGATIWLLEHRHNSDFHGVGPVLYFSFSTLVFAHRERLATNSGRLAAVLWFFVVLILQANYTARLTSMLTVEQLTPTVEDIDQLLRDGSAVGYLEDSFVQGLLKSLKFNESKIIPYQSAEDYHQALINGSVAAIVDEVPYLKVFMDKYCHKNFKMIGPIYKTSGFGFAFPKGSPFVGEVSRAILKVMQNNTLMQKLEESLYPTVCADMDTDTESSRLTFRSFWGLFLITGTTSLSALILHAIFFLRQRRPSLLNYVLSPLRRFGMMVQLFGQRGSSPQASEDPKPGEESTRSAVVLALPYAGAEGNGWRSPSSIASQDHGDAASQGDAAETWPQEEGASSR
ncbi:glutamate receptor 2.9-like [Curcuma longa]|uniref:glutamate receptor 2.9-like n=1 Tax=Curcuma longa TaxID=136217 RepID=UPI003D9F2B1A